MTPEVIEDDEDDTEGWDLPVKGEEKAAAWDEYKEDWYSAERMATKQEQFDDWWGRWQEGSWQEGSWQDEQAQGRDEQDQEWQDQHAHQWQDQKADAQGQEEQQDHGWQDQQGWQEQQAQGWHEQQAHEGWQEQQAQGWQGAAADIIREPAPWAAGGAAAGNRGHICNSMRPQKIPGRSWIHPVTGEKLWTSDEDGRTYARLVVDHRPIYFCLA